MCFTKVSSSNFTKEERRAGLWWTSSVNSNNERCAIYSDGITKWEPAYPRTIGARPVISYELIKDEIESSEDNVFEVEFGEYPQTIAEKEISVSLEELYEQIEDKFKKLGARIERMDENEEI